MKRMTLMDYINYRRASDSPLSETCLAGIDRYLSRYSNDVEPSKYYDGDMGEAIFPTLKQVMNDETRSREQRRLAKKVRKELVRGIKDKGLTKQFYIKQKLFDTLEGFGQGFVSNHDYLQSLQESIEYVLGDMCVTRLQPLLVQNDDFNIRRNITKMTSSAGFRAYGLKKEDITDETIDEVIQIYHRIEAGEDPENIIINPALAFTRSQYGTVSEDLYYDRDTTSKFYKGRLVWCLDAVFVLYESQFARPLIEHLSGVWDGTAMGKVPAKIRLLSLQIANKGDWLSIDYSKYDSSVQAWLIRVAFWMVKQFYDPKYWKHIDLICHNFINTAVLMPDGRIYFKAKGIPSGSYFTQIIGTICNALMITSFVVTRIKKRSRDHGVTYSFDECFRYNGHGAMLFIALGDDNLVSSTLKLDRFELADYLLKVYGVTMNPDKCKHGNRGTAPAFLKRYWTLEGERRDAVDLLLNALHPERKRNYKGFSPWHILFGYFLTYEVTMKEIGFTKNLIVRKMEEHGGFDLLRSIPREELPGSLATIKTCSTKYWNIWLDGIKRDVFYLEDSA